MNRSENNDQMIDDELAEFTDRILEKSTKEDESLLSTNLELHGLEKMAQHMKNAFPEDGPNEAVIQRMRQNIVSQWQKQENEARKVFWKRWVAALKPSMSKWESQRSRQRWELLAYLTVVFLLLLINLPFLDKIAFNQSAASGQTLIVSKYAAIAAFILLAVWIFRRKQ
jgi:hypothetical protein